MKKSRIVEVHTKSLTFCYVVEPTGEEITLPVTYDRQSNKFTVRVNEPDFDAIGRPFANERNNVLNDLRRLISVSGQVHVRAGWTVETQSA